MGLDSFLYKKVWVNNNRKNNTHQVVDKTVEIFDKEYPLKDLEYLVYEVGYWGKANAIHKWFVDNIQDGVDDCKEYYININDIKKLIDVCKQVKESLESSYDSKTNSYLNTKVAQELLPSQMGFFFGDTDYNEYYLEDINNTINQLEPLLKKKENEYFYYLSSW